MCASPGHPRHVVHNKFCAARPPFSLTLRSVSNPQHRSASRLTSLLATLPQNPPLSPIIATLPKTPSRNPFVCHTCDTPRGVHLHAHLPSVSAHSASSGISALNPSLLLPVFRTLFQVPDALSPLFLTLTKTAGVYSLSSHSGNGKLCCSRKRFEVDCHA
jgi:hypothetical protein